MNQFNWTYLADNGKRHQVVLMHGASSGHLLVYCNTTILLIDFSVLKTSTYSFFIEDELCELTIERKDDQFLYGFEVNREANTPLNNQRKKRDKKHLYQSIFFMGGLLLVVSLFIVGLTYYHQQKSQEGLIEQLLTSGETTTAQIILSPKAKPGAIKYVFFANGASYQGTLGSFSQDDQTTPVLENGIPLEEGDEFLLQYLPTTPQRHQLDLNQPTESTIREYQTRAARQYLIKFPEVSLEKAQCLAKVAFSVHQLDGLADFYHANTSPLKNQLHNEDSFFRLIRDLPFQQAATEACQHL